MHPEAFGSHDLFYHIATTAFASVLRTDVACDFADFVGCIGWAAGKSCTLHDFVVRNVVAHIEHFLVFQTVLLAEHFVGFEFDGNAHHDVCQSQSFVALANGVRLSACDDAKAKSALHGILHGVAVADVNRSHRFSVGMQTDGLSAEHAIHIEEEGTYLGEVIVDHLFLYFVSGAEALC